MAVAVVVGDSSIQQPTGSVGSNNFKFKCEQYQIIIKKRRELFPALLICSQFSNDTSVSVGVMT